MTDTPFTRLLSIDEVARLLNISLPYTYKLLRDGSLRSVRMGRAVRVRPEDLDAYIDECIFYGFKRREEELLVGGEDE